MQTFSKFEIYMHVLEIAFKDSANSIKAAVAFWSEKWREGQKGRGAWWVVFSYFFFCAEIDIIQAFKLFCWFNSGKRRGGLCGFFFFFFCASTTKYVHFNSFFCFNPPPPPSIFNLLLTFIGWYFSGKMTKSEESQTKHSAAYTTRYIIIDQGAKAQTLTPNTHTPV